jgi:hypothetical protein
MPLNVLKYARMGIRNLVLKPPAYLMIFFNLVSSSNINFTMGNVLLLIHGSVNYS